MLYLTTVCYFFCFYLASKKKIYALCSFLPIYTLLFLYLVFGDYFVTANNGFVDINFWLFIICSIYFSFEFLLIYFSYKKTFLWILLCSVFLAFAPYTNLVIPLNILILFYPDIYLFLPKFDIPLFNLFFLYFIPMFIFYRIGLKWKFFFVVFFLICFSIQTSVNSREKIKLAIVQVGLYYKNGGNENDFFNDLSVFLKNNSDVDLVVFSENVFYGHKNEYSRKRTDKLLSDLENSGVLDKHSFLFNFYGFNNLNNVVSVFKTKNEEVINQKEILIPFIEKEGLFNQRSTFESKFISVDETHKNKKVYLNDSGVDSYICYEALFPKMSNNRVIVVQSDYNQLNKGSKYNEILRHGAILSRFSSGVNSGIFINIQNLGGTVIIDNMWRVNKHLYEESKKEPFLIINSDLS